MQVFGVSYKTRASRDDRWAHTHYEHLPCLEYYFQDTPYSPHYKTEHNTGTLNRNSPIVDRFNEKLREEWSNRFDVGRDFWDERTRLEYEQSLNCAIEAAMLEVEHEFNRRFVQYIEQRITESDPLYSFVKNGDNQ